MIGHDQIGRPVEVLPSHYRLVRVGLGVGHQQLEPTSVEAGVDGIEARLDHIGQMPHEFGQLTKT